MNGKKEFFHEILNASLLNNPDYIRIAKSIDALYGDSAEIELWYKLIDCYIDAAYELTAV